MDITMAILLYMALGGTDNPPPEMTCGIDENGMQWCQEPGLLPTTIAANSGQVCGAPNYALFLSDNWWPWNFSQNITRNLTA